MTNGEGSGELLIPVLTPPSEAIEGIVNIGNIVLIFLMTALAVVVILCTLFS
jgi:hypothetical protein